MQGLMMNRPLLIADILEFAAQTHATAEVVSARVEGDVNRLGYARIRDRAAQLAHALTGAGVGRGDRVATLAWNGHRHLELYYGISGMGAVCHTINPRLPRGQMEYILGHAAPKLLFADVTFEPILGGIDLPDGLRVVWLAEEDAAPGESYEAMIGDQRPEFDWPELDEDAAAGLCYTSGTTGRPKGALYSHRSTVLHALSVIASIPGALAPSQRILPVVPLFHVNAWGLPYAAPLAGASVVFPGPRLDGASLWDLMDAEAVTSAWGVPTVWMGLKAEIETRGALPGAFKEVVVGGSAAPRPLIEFFERQGVGVNHAWGMTEMSPIGTQGVLPADMEDMPLGERVAVKGAQGRRIFGVDLKIVGEDGERLPHDGQAQGELAVRGPAVVSGYFEDEEASRAAIDAEGWFRTGDVASIDERGFLRIADRSKDLIKSGGEWISSLDLEDVVMKHPRVAACAVIAVPHEKWDERPLLVAVPAGEAPQASEIMELLSKDFARWQLPDDVVWVEELPLTATGKVSKLTLREQFKDHPMPGAPA